MKMSEKKSNIKVLLEKGVKIPNPESVEIGDDIIPNYQVLPGSSKYLKDIKKSAKTAETLYLATDLDRQGEAIAWHTADILKKKGRRFHRVLFHELTKTAIREAMASPEALNPDKYEAQQARRILDRLVGYQVSPLLWRKVKGGLSAGRVQSVAVRIICERERAIQAFVSEEYWSISAHLESDTPPAFVAKLVKKDREKIKIPHKKAADQILKELEGEKFIVEDIHKRTTKKNPLPPFIDRSSPHEALLRRPAGR